ncbi:MAG: hypothetical protein GY847_03900 [Proteobacteria bacterium]|nr:hypothetical protein [Pseudomonadota bacterium]
MRWLQIALVCWITTAVGCHTADETEKKAAPIEKKVALDDKVEPLEQKAEPAVKKEPDKEVKDPRQALLEEEYDAFADNPLTRSAAGLSPNEKKMLGNLLVAAKLIEELYMLQVHPNNLKWRDQIMAKGTDIEKKIFSRYQMPWCENNKSPDCSALPDGPEKKTGHVHWPEDLTDEEYENLSKEINGKELLSPFTVVRRKKTGGFDAIPYSQTEIFGGKMKEIAASLRKAAKTAPCDSLKKFLKSRADAFEADSAFPYDESDYDWIALDCDWDISVGPYETYKNPREIKALFDIYIGRQEKELTTQLSLFKENLQEMENALQELVGPDIYTSRKLDPRIAIRAVDMWMVAGNGRAGGGAIVAFHLPNRGKSIDEGLYKKVIITNHSRAFDPIYKARAELVLAKSNLEFLDIDSSIANTTFHEFSHGFGAYGEMKIKNPKGKTTTVAQALKEHRSLLEELKADVFGGWLIQYQKKKDWLKPGHEKKRYTAKLMHVLGLLQYPLDGTYPRMAAIQLGWYMNTGAVSWDPSEGRFNMDTDKMPAAIESLAKKVATIQLTGDYDQGKKLIESFIVIKGKTQFELKGVLAEAREVMVEKFKKAKIKSPSLKYEIVDL